jgi:hypothetical protein
MRSCFDCGGPINIHFNEPAARAIAIPLLRKAYLTDRRGTVRLARELGWSPEQFAARAITLRWRDCGALSGDSHLDDTIACRAAVALSTIYPEPQQCFLRMASLMPAHWSREEQAGAAISAHIEDWLNGDL